MRFVGGFLEIYEGVWVRFDGVQAVVVHSVQMCKNAAGEHEHTNFVCAQRTFDRCGNVMEELEHILVPPQIEKRSN